MRRRRTRRSVRVWRATIGKAIRRQESIGRVLQSAYMNGFTSVMNESTKLWGSLSGAERAFAEGFATQLARTTGEAARDVRRMMP